MRVKFLSILIILLIVSGCEKSEKKAPHEKPLPDVAVYSVVDRAVIPLGDVAQFTITVNSDPKISVNIPDLSKKFAGLRIVDYEPDKETVEHQRKIKKKWYRLKADTVGSYLLPEIEFSYVLPTGEAKKVKTPRIFLEVTSENEDNEKKEENDIRDIKPLYLIPYDWKGVIFAVIFIVLFCFCFLIWKWRKAKKEIPSPPLPPHEVALAKINALKIRWEANEIPFKQLHYELSEVVRAYLSGRFGMSAIEMTLEEIRHALKSLSDLPDFEKPRLLDLLGQTDRVKFTDYIPSEEVSVAIIASALSFVEATEQVATMGDQGA
jgi:hypothetical protein